MAAKKKPAKKKPTKKGATRKTTGSKKPRAPRAAKTTTPPDLTEGGGIGDGCSSGGCGGFDDDGF